MIKTVFIFQTQVSAIVVLNFILVAFKDVCIFCTSYIGVQSLYLLVISCFTVIVTWHVSVFHLVLLLLCHYLYWFHLCLIKFLEYPFGLCELFVFSIQLAVLLCPWISFLLIDFCNSLNNCLDFCLTLATFCLSISGPQLLHFALQNLKIVTHSNCKYNCEYVI